MTPGAIIQNRWARWLAGFLFWTLLGLSFASQFYISSAKAELGVTWKQAVSYALGDWYVFALLSIPVVRLGRVLPLDSGNRAWRLAAHAGASVLFSLGYVVLRSLVGQVQSGAGFAEVFRPLLVKTWHFNLLTYWVILAVSQAFDFYRKYRARERHAAQLEQHLTQAKLQALQMQLNPHFLFNTLHSISALMHKDIEAADRMVTRLSDLLRTALDSSDSQEVPLRQELDFLGTYLEIERIRFGDRLRVEMHIAPETMEAKVPNLVLQPLVENAIRHGIEPRARPGSIQIRACRRGDALALQVIDNGAGMPRGNPPREGVGLANTRARLRELYGGAHRFEMLNAEQGGLEVKLDIPFRVESDSHEDTNTHR
jgi:signal transduction histidine kinase